MKKIATFVFLFLLIGVTSYATTNSSTTSECDLINRFDGSAYIFQESGVEFSVFPDGQFDFSYLGNSHGGQIEVVVSSTNVSMSFNAGRDYELFVQYDDYGAVTQIENVPIYYDHYGRITRAGNVDIRYNNRRIVRVGGLFVNYNQYGHYISTSGFINTDNRFYVYRPWHAFYVAPFFSNCIVYDYPYRRYYQPIRYSYTNHRNYYQNRHRTAYRNARRSFHRPGSRIHYRNGRSMRNTSFNPNRRNTMISDSGRGNTTLKGRTLTSNRKTDRSGASSISRVISSNKNNMAKAARPSSNSTSRPSVSHEKVIRSRPTTHKERSATSRPTASRRTASNRNKTKEVTLKGRANAKANELQRSGKRINSRASSSKRRGL
jgi:hypothetical protein